MVEPIRYRQFLLFSLCALASLPVQAQSFSCNFGQPACLGYNDKVVDQSAQCFDRNTCWPGGFVCKNEYDELVTKAKRIASNYDDLRLCLSSARDIDDVETCIRNDNLRF